MNLHQTVVVSLKYIVKDQTIFTPCSSNLWRKFCTRRQKKIKDWFLSAVSLIINEGHSKHLSLIKMSLIVSEYVGSSLIWRDNNWIRVALKASLQDLNVVILRCDHQHAVCKVFSRIEKTWHLDVKLNFTKQVVKYKLFMSSLKLLLAKSLSRRFVSQLVHELDP